MLISNISENLPWTSDGPQSSRTPEVSGDACVRLFLTKICGKEKHDFLCQDWFKCAKCRKEIFEIGSES